MKKLCVAVLVLVAAACASSPAGELETIPATTTAAPDPRVAELQTQLRAFGRIDVLNQRIAQLGKLSGRVVTSRVAESFSRRVIKSSS
jgi:hypothetical protein